MTFPLFCLLLAKAASFLLGLSQPEPVPELQTGRSSTLVDIFRMSQSTMIPYMSIYYLCPKSVADFSSIHLPISQVKNLGFTLELSPFLPHSSTRSLCVSKSSLSLALESVLSPPCLSLLQQFRHLLLLDWIITTTSYLVSQCLVLIPEYITTIFRRNCQNSRLTIPALLSSL